jgi:hypothetical protein
MNSIHRELSNSGVSKQINATSSKNWTPVTRFGKMSACGMSALIDLGFIL